MWLFIWVLGIWTRVLENGKQAFLPTELPPQPHALSSLPLWPHHIRFLPNTLHSCAPRESILPTDHNLFSRCLTTGRFPVNEAAVKIFLQMVFCYWIIFPRMYSPKGDNVLPTPTPSARDGTKMKWALLPSLSLRNPRQALWPSASPCWILGRLRLT